MKITPLAISTLLLATACSGPKVSAHASLTEKVESHDEAIHVLDVWMRDPFITRGPDDAYYLTGTTANQGDPRWLEDRYNSGLDRQDITGSPVPSIVGATVRVWRSESLVDWDELPTPFSLTDGYWPEAEPEAFATVPEKDWRLWAPEVHYLNGQWMIVHTSPAPVRQGANLAIPHGTGFTGPFSHPMKEQMKGRHDPSLFQDDDGTIYLLWGNTWIAPLRPDLSGFAAEPVRIDPADRIIGHEGATMARIGDKYVHFGTAWSTDRMRQGSYNLYYCVADSPMGPFGPRQFAGRFLGHGTPFQDRQGRWWCTAFYNANVPPISDENIQTRDLGADAHTINEQGVTLVPLDVRVFAGGYVYIRAKDPRYAVPGPDEAQDFGIDPTADAKRAAVEAHDRAVHIHDHWIRDPYILVDGDDYILTGTTLEAGMDGIVGISTWRSQDLVNWQEQPRLWRFEDTHWIDLDQPVKHHAGKLLVWAPELHRIGDRWAIVHTTNNAFANLLVTAGSELAAPLIEPMGPDFGRRHDPSIFVDNGIPWLVSGVLSLQALKPDLSAYAGREIKLAPADREMGHEGSYIIKVGAKYVWFGTAWSTDQPRKGTYNLYYATADALTGPYGHRRFAGRFLGHGTPFQDKQGRWWCTAFYNANVPALDPAEAAARDLSDTAYTINRQGTTLVPLDITTDASGEVWVRAKDPAYTYPGPEEVQQFRASTK
jgi:xylan 1,4-beta-xylosidase